jgi:hypothetical protein
MRGLGVRLRDGSCAQVRFRLAMGRLLPPQIFVHALERRLPHVAADR